MCAPLLVTRSLCAHGGNEETSGANEANEQKLRMQKLFEAPLVAPEESKADGRTGGRRGPRERGVGGEGEDRAAATSPFTHTD